MFWHVTCNSYSKKEIYHIPKDKMRQYQQLASYLYIPQKEFL